MAKRGSITELPSSHVVGQPEPWPISATEAGRAPSAVDECSSGHHMAPMLQRKHRSGVGWQSGIVQQTSSRNLKAFLRGDPTTHWWRFWRAEVLKKVLGLVVRISVGSGRRNLSGRCVRDRVNIAFRIGWWHGQVSQVTLSQKPTIVNLRTCPVETKAPCASTRRRGVVAWLRSSPSGGGHPDVTAECERVLALIVRVCERSWEIEGHCGRTL